MANVGIYAIVNRLTGDWYVGQSTNVERRRRQHWKALRGGRHGCQRLQRAFLKYGEAAFVFVVLEQAPVADLDRREQQYLDAGFACGTLYNTARCAEAPARGAKRSPEACAANGKRKREEFADPESRLVHAQKITAALADPDVRARMRQPRSEAGRAAHAAGAQKRASNPESLAALRAGLAKRGEAWREKTSARFKGWTSDPSRVAQHLDAMRTRSEDPAWQQMMRERNARLAADPTWRNSVKAAHATPSARANHGEATRRRFAEMKKDPIVWAAYCQKMRDVRSGRSGVNG